MPTPLSSRYTELRVANASDHAEVFATEFVLKLLKKRLFSSPAAFARTLAKHRETIANARRTRGSSKVSVGVLRLQADKVDESFETEDEYEQAEDEAQSSSARLFHPLSPEEEQLLDKLAAWAERASTRPDAKAQALLDLIEATCRPGGAWNGERLIIFTEYRDTQKWLLDLLAARGLTEAGRTRVIFGGMDSDERAEIKAAFQADPEQSPVRILVATDAASEGINLQNHCHRLVHYEIPWNPNRLEQRNGRVDRHGQRASEVLVYHFAPAGWQELKDVDTVPVGKLEGDLEFLRRAVVKVEEIREMLGKVGPVIADQVADAMLGRRRTLDTRRSEQEGEAVRRQLRFERELEKELRRLEESYDETRAEQHLTPAHVHDAVETALSLARQPALIPNGDGVYRLPALTGTWARASEGLAHPYTGEIRPLTFDPVTATGRDDVVLCHLGHRLVQMSLGLLRAEIWQPSAARSLERVTARLVDDPRLREPVAIAYARFVVTGADGHRLHEELIHAGGEISAGKLERLGVNALKEKLELPRGGPVSAATQERLLALYEQIALSLSQAVDARAKERAESLNRIVGERRDEEVAKITAVLEQLRDSDPLGARRARWRAARPLQRRRARTAPTEPRLPSRSRRRDPRRDRTGSRVAAPAVRRSRATRVPGRGRVPRPTGSGRRMSPRPRRSSAASHHVEWLQLVDISGPFLSLSVLTEAFPQGLDGVDPEIAERLRTAYSEWTANRELRHPDVALHTAFLRFVLTEILEYPNEFIADTQALGDQFIAPLPEHGVTLRPDLAIRRPGELPKLLLIDLPGGGSRCRSPTTIAASTHLRPSGCGCSCARPASAPGW